MQLNVHSVHFNADVKLLDFVQQKVGKLNQYYDNIINGEVYLKLDRSKDMENKVAEIKLSIPGKDLFVKKQCKSFEEATDVAVSALQRQIKRYKGKMRPV